MSESSHTLGEKDYLLFTLVGVALLMVVTGGILVLSAL
jgi:hypothetical protein